MTEDDPRIAKLPAWAREHIETLTRERDAAMRRYREFVDSQPDSPFYYEAMNPDSKERLPVEHHVKTWAVGCRRGNLTVELAIRDTHPGIMIRFDHREGTGRTAIFPECNNVMRIIEIPDEYG